MLLDELFEGVNDYTLYHNVRHGDKHTETNLLSIARGGPLIARTRNRVNNLTNRKLPGKTYQNDDENRDDDDYTDGDHHDAKQQRAGEIVTGTSFTRNKHFALTGMTFGEICFEVDSRKLKSRNKLIPIDDMVVDRDMSDKADLAGVGRRTEFEEFVVGDIKEFARCITKIHVKYKTTMFKGKKNDATIHIEKAIAELKKNYPNIEIIDGSSHQSVHGHDLQFTKSRLIKELADIKKLHASIQTELMKDGHGRQVLRMGDWVDEHIISFEDAIKDINNRVIDHDDDDESQQLRAVNRAETELRMLKRYITRFWENVAAQTKERATN